MRTVRVVRRVVKVVAIGLLVAAVVQEASKPRADRTWHGRVFGFVPYDFSPPTWGRIRRAYWNPEDGRLHRARALLSGLFGRLVRNGDRSVRLDHPGGD
jgi:hypothetical protein